MGVWVDVKRNSVLANRHTVLTGESLGGNAKRNPSCGMAQSGLSN